MDQSAIIEKLLGILSQQTEEKGVSVADESFNKNVQTDGSSTAKPGSRVPSTLSSNEIRRTTQIANLFAKEFFAYKKKYTPDEKPKTLVTDINRKQKKTEGGGNDKKCEGWGSVMALLIGGVALIAAAIPAIIASLFGEVGFLADSLKIFGKVGLIGGLKMLSKGMLKFFATPLLKRIPIIGSLINFWMAYKHFKAGGPGDIVKGVMELVGGILNFVPVVGTTLSIGVDILKAFLENKGAFDEGGMLSNANAWNTIKGWGVSIGNWIWDNALWIPVIGGVKRFGMAKDAFASGSYGEGFKQLAYAVLSFGGAAPLVTGFEMLYGMLTNKEDNSKDLSPDSSWASRLKGWIKEKLKQLPYAIRKPLEWFGIVDSSGESQISWSGVKEGAKKGFDGVKGFMSNAWSKVSEATGIGVEDITGFATEAWNKTKEWSATAWDKTKEQAPLIWNAVKENSQKAFDATVKAGGLFVGGIKDLAAKTTEKIKEFAPAVVEVISGIAGKAMETLKNIASKIGGWIADLFTPDEEKKLKESRISSEKEKIFSKEDQRMTTALLQSSNNHSQWLKMLHDSAKEQVRLLGALVNVNNMSLQELKRIAGSSGGGGSVNISMPSQQSKSSPVSMGNNRGGFASSAYALA